MEGPNGNDIPSLDDPTIVRALPAPDLTPPISPQLLASPQRRATRAPLGKTFAVGPAGFRASTTPRARRAQEFAEGMERHLESLLELSSIQEEMKKVVGWGND